MSGLLRIARFRLLYLVLGILLTFANQILCKVDSMEIRIAEQQGQRSPQNYSREELFALGKHVKQDFRLRIIQPSAVKNIRRLQLNKRGKRGGRKIRYHNFELLESARIPVQTSGIKTCKKKLQLVTLNAQSIKNKMDKITTYLHDIKADLCVITETWLQDTETDKIWLDTQCLGDLNYGIKLNNKKENKGGGIALLFNSRYKILRSTKCNKSTFQATLWSMKIGTTTLWVLGVYHPPFGSKKDNTPTNFIDELTDLLVKIVAEHSNLVLLGDFNIHINDYDVDTNCQMFVDTLEALGLKIWNNGATHRLDNQLDIIATEVLGKIYVSNIENGPFISDHAAVQCNNKKIHKPDISREIRIVRNLKSIDTQSFIKDIEESVSKIPDTEDVNYLASSLQKKLRKALDDHAPEVKKELTVRKKVPWFTPEIKDLKRALRRSEQKWRKYKEHHQWLAFKQNQKLYSRALKNSKIKTVSGKVSQIRKDTKKLFKLVKHLTGTEGENPMPSERSNEELAEDFAEFFIGKIQTIRENLDQFPEYEEQYRDVPQMNSFKPLTKQDITKLLNSMAAKSCENNCIPSDLLRQISPCIIEILSKIINLSLSQGVFIDKWKSAIVRPLLKKAGLELISKNYRPVSNLIFLSKLLEKAALTQIIGHWEEHQLLPDYQSAYRSNRSCETVLIKMVNDILWNMEKQEVSALVAIDLSAAFDTVSHNILLNVLQKRYGINNEVLKWSESYLSPRNFRVVVNGKFSN